MVSSELIDVLFYNNIEEFLSFYKELNRRYFPNNVVEYSKQFNNYLLEKIESKEKFIQRINDYHHNGKTIWQNQKFQNCDCLNDKDIVRAMNFATHENGEKRFISYRQAVEKWAFYLDNYANKVNYKDNINILELATGGGLGTSAVINALLPNNRLVSVDIDFEAVKNADGLAQFFNFSNRVCGLNANFWMLPFENEIFECACTHYGLDETREIQAVLKEAARVLKLNGRFIVVARMNPFDRHKDIMNLFDISEVECNQLLKKARLYSGFEDLVQSAFECGLTLVEHELYELKNGQNRILYIFQKL